MVATGGRKLLSKAEKDAKAAAQRDKRAAAKASRQAAVQDDVHDDIMADLEENLRGAYRESSAQREIADKAEKANRRLKRKLAVVEERLAYFQGRRTYYKEACRGLQTEVESWMEAARVLQEDPVNALPVVPAPPAAPAPQAGAGPAPALPAPPVLPALPAPPAGAAPVPQAQVKKTARELLSELRALMPDISDSVQMFFTELFGDLWTNV